jgi:poly-gamma-glutamate synthesis protein (capsule biosynthesis protein)
MFQNRREAGRALAPLLRKYEKNPNAIVIGLPRGGVVTASEISKALSLPLDVVCPRKVGAPYNPELALGAVTHTGEGYFNQDIIAQLGVSDTFLRDAIERERKTAEVRQNIYRCHRPPLDIKGKIVILVDDGLATGATMKAAIGWVRAERASRIVVAIPVSPPDTLTEVKALADEVVCLLAPAFFSAVGQFYEDFSQTSDEEVMECLKEDPHNNICHIGFAGDVMIGRLVNEELRRVPPSYIWGNMLPIISKCDLHVINLEAALTKSEHIVEKVFNFKSDPSHVRALEEAKIDVVNLANNHVLDFGKEGLAETLETLDRAHIFHVGAGKNIADARAAVIVEKNGISIGILGCTDNEPSWKAGQDEPGINYVRVGDLEAIQDEIRRLREKVDILILSMHWGPNMVSRPSREFVSFAHALIDAGVDIIHGHSAHLFQGIECYKNGLIMYDTGDFIDDYYVDPERRNDESFFFIVEVSPKGVRSLGLVPTHISNCQVNRALEARREKMIKRIKALSRELGCDLEKIPCTFD